MNGHVVCLSKADGTELWRTKLRGRGTVCAIFDEQGIFAATDGHLYGLQLQDGQIRWVNKLRKLGYGNCVLASADQSTVAVLNVIAQQQALMMAAVAGAATTSAAAAGST